MRLIEFSGGKFCKGRFFINADQVAIVAETTDQGYTQISFSGRMEDDYVVVKGDLAAVVEALRRGGWAQ